MPYYEALPDDIKPVHYDLSIFDIDLSNDSYNGLVKIDLKIINDTNKLTLHFRELKIQTVEARCNGHHLTGSIIDENIKKETFTVEFPSALSGTANVEIAFSGKIQSNMAGFYKSPYKDAISGDEKIMLSTQFEATDARRAFPCFDEPALKATFSVHVTTETEATVLGNTPVEKEIKLENSKVTSFEKTPIMSTYLLAWAIGEFEYIESSTSLFNGSVKPIPVRVYTTPGYKEKAQLAVELAPKIVDYFSKIFELRYPLPKLDLLAVHSFSHNAMENWGLITYRSTALLYDPETSDPEYRQKVAYVVAHEIAHQWFGNLVTMQWWDELWLNEGFATWVGYLAVDHLFPEWDIFTVFVSNSLQTALTLDGLRNSHPIKVPVYDALDIDQLFDQISYLKGASTILMLSGFLGADVFLKGVAIYLNGKQYGNATSDDLWAGLTKASGKDVDHMMHKWINSIGFPVVSASPAGEDQMKLHQQRFLNGGGVKDEENQTKWWIPLNGDGNIGKDFPVAFSEESAVVPLPQGFFKLNKDTQSFIRVNYHPQLLKTSILPHFHKLSSKDKVGVIADVAAIAVSGDSQTSTTTFLELVKSIVIDNDHIGDDYVAWLELTHRLSAFVTVFCGHGDEQLTSLVKGFVRKVYTKMAVKIAVGWTENAKTETVLQAKLKVHMLNAAMAYGIPAVDDLARRLYLEWINTGKIDPSLRYFVFSSIVSKPDATQADVDAIFGQVTHPTTLDSREIALLALGNVTNQTISKKLTGELGQDSIPVMDAHFYAGAMSKNVKTRDILWRYVQDNYDVLYKKMSTNMVVLDRFIKMTLGNYGTEKMAEEVRVFFGKRDTHGFERSLGQVLDQISINAAWYNRDHGAVKQWLA